VSNITFFNAIGSDPTLVLKLLPKTPGSDAPDVELIETLLEYTPDKNINMGDPATGETMLHYAATYYKRDIILKVIEKGGNIMARDKNDSLPLLLALNKKNRK
jgi:hypothetical protein